MRFRDKVPSRPGVAAVELAVVLPLLLILLMGVWELGRYIEVQQLLSNACREGGRQASTGVKSTAQVKAVVVNYLKLNGISKVSESDVTVVNLTSSSRPEPNQADQMDRFQISVSISADNVRWIMLPRVSGVNTLSATVDWYSMRDLPITVDDTIPVE